MKVRVSLGGAASVLAYVLVITSFFLPAGLRAEVLVGRLVRVIDGDTVSVRVSINKRVLVRISGIDAPERGQPFAAAARQRLVVLALDRDVTVNWRKLDRYGRVVGRVVLTEAGTELDIGLEQISAGLAWHYKAYAREQQKAERNSYAEAEAHARLALRGLWIDANPVAPWLYRHDKQLHAP